MRSKNLAFNPALDHIRFLAAGLVFGFHVFHVHFGGFKPLPDLWYLGLITEGHTGVALFFTLSGFLFMSIALHSREIDYKSFMINRFLRIFPLFLFVFFIAISVGRDKFGAADILYVFFSNLGQAPTSSTLLTGAAWTISIEFTFYMIFPFLARFALDRGPSYLAQLLVILLLVKLAAYGVSDKPTLMYNSTLVGRLDQLLIGMLASQLMHQFQPGPEKARLILVAGAVAIFAMVGFQARFASYFLPEPRQPFWIVWSMIEASCWALFVAGYSAARIRWPAPLARFFEQGGEISYSFYLLHLMIIVTLRTTLGTLAASFGTVAAFAVNALFAFLLTWIFAGMTFRLLEEPFLAMRRRYVVEETRRAA